MTRSKVVMIFDCAKYLELSLSIVFLENGVQQKEHINFNSEYFNDVWIDNDDLHFYDNSIKRWIIINIAKIEYIRIHEKIIS